MEFLLFALQPPGNVQHAVRELQESLYSRWGLVSPLALPPLIPLAFFARPSGSLERPVRTLAEELRRSLRGPSAARAPRLATAGLAVVQEALFWELAGEVAPFRDLVRARAAWPPLAPPPFPEHLGFFLALAEPGADLRLAASAATPPPSLLLPAVALSLLAVRTLKLEPIPPDTELPVQPPWYRALEWEELLNVPLKKPERRQPQEAG